MKGTIIVCGHGPGISDAVARRFGKEGFSVAPVARSEERLAKAAASLGEAGITAKAFSCDLGDPDAVRAMVRDVHDSLGPVSVLHWNAIRRAAGDLTTCKTEDLRAVLDVGVHGMVAAIQESLSDLRASKGAVLVTGGGLALFDPRMDGIAVGLGSMGLAVAKAAQHKAVGLLHQKLAPEGVYVGEVVVLGIVKGTASDGGNATIDPAAVAERFWDLHRNRAETSVNIA
ncbi:MAG: SDR family NAD(P)-dependent oxidoreductase [Polyangiaceae bacterium]